MNSFRMNRRQWLLHAGAAATAGATLPFSASVHAQSEPLRIGQSVALSGPLAELGRDMHGGALAFFAALNARGGVNGRRIELTARDDSYNVPRALSNVKAFLADNSVFALFGCMGTPMVEAMLPLLKGTDVPLFAPLTGASSVRLAGMRNALNVRASYPEETDRLIEHLATVRIRRLAIVAQHNSFGDEVTRAAGNAVTRHGLDAVAVVTVENDGSDAAAAAAKVAAAAPEAVFIGLAGKPTIDFVRAIRAQRRGLPLYALSVMGSGSMLGALKDDAYGMAITQVVPLPSNPVMPVVRDFQKAWHEHGNGAPASHLALEGYINARVFAEVLKRSGPKPTRASFIDAAYGLKNLDLGGFDVGFSEPGRNASRFIELTMVGRNGRFVR